MKVIFLDIDGVLATVQEFLMDEKKFKKKNFVAQHVRFPYPFNNGCVKVFNEILLKTDAEIVLSSDWRRYWTLDQLDLIFRFNGVIKSPKDVTEIDPVSMSWLEKNRANEIGKYLLNNRDIKQWVVIDDLNMSEFMKKTNDDDKMFLTEGIEGIKKSSLKDKIISKLNEQK
jgi:hypothetical protein